MVRYRDIAVLTDSHLHDTYLDQIQNVKQWKVRFVSMMKSKHLKRVKMKRNIKGLYRILMSSVGEGASLAAAVITDGLATLATVVLQKNIFVMGSAVEHISERNVENIPCNGKQQRIFHVKPIQKVIIDDLATLAAVVLQKNIFAISCGQCSGT